MSALEQTAEGLKGSMWPFKHATEPGDAGRLLLVWLPLTGKPRETSLCQGGGINNGQRMAFKCW